MSRANAISVAERVAVVPAHVFSDVVDGVFVGAAVVDFVVDILATAASSADCAFAGNWQTARVRVRRAAGVCAVIVAGASRIIAIALMARACEVATTKCGRGVSGDDRARAT